MYLYVLSSVWSAVDRMILVQILQYTPTFVN